MAGQRILIRAGKDPRTPLSAEAALSSCPQAVFGTNIGNALFSDAVWRILSVPGAELTADSYSTERQHAAVERHADRINSEFDHVVLPLANAFRDKAWWLGNLTRVVERLTIPVTVVGVGASTTLSGEGVLSEAMELLVRDFMRAVLDHSARVGVRGELTAGYLKNLGFGSEHVEVIGCPSVYLNGPHYQVARKPAHITKASKVALTVTPSVDAFAPLVGSLVQDYPNLVYVPQETSDLTLMMWGDERRDGHFRPEMPVTADHVLYRDDRMLFPLDARTWVDMLKDMDLVFGTRIHGTIAGLLAGVPSLAVSFSSRMLELANWHHIPLRRVSSLPATTDLPTLYDECSWDDFNANLQPRFAVLTGFLEANGLAHCYQPGAANPDFDAELATAAFPPPVHALTPASPMFAQDLRARLSWLRQGPATDARRDQKQPYRPPFAPES